VSAGNEYYRTYCFSCGWNFESVFCKRERLDRTGFVIVGALAGMVLIPLGRHGAAVRTLLILTGFFSILGLLVFLTARKERSRVLALKEKVLSHPGVDLSSVFPEELPARAVTLRDQIRGLPKPRELKPSVDLRVLIWVFRVLAAGLFLMMLSAYRHPVTTNSAWMNALDLAFMVAIPIGTYLLEIKYWKKIPNRELLETGDVAFVRAYSRKKLLQPSRVTFTLWDKDGQSRELTCRNFSSCIFDGALIPVFYRSDDSEQFVAGCSTQFEVALPDNSDPPQSS